MGLIRRSVDLPTRPFDTWRGPAAREATAAISRRVRPQPEPFQPGARTNPKPIPEGYHTITPHLHVNDGVAALRFYEEAFGAEETFRLDGPPGKIGHAEMRIGDSPFIFADEMEAWGNRSPRTLGGSGFSLMVYVEDVDAAFERAVAAGAKAVMPVENHFYGDREDPG
jgi:PhnB protein